MANCTALYCMLYSLVTQAHLKGRVNPGHYSLAIVNLETESPRNRRLDKELKGWRLGRWRGREGGREGGRKRVRER